MKLELNNTPSNRSTIAKLFPTQLRNVRIRINNDKAFVSNLTIEWNLITNQVSEGPDTLPNNLGNENV